MSLNNGIYSKDFRFPRKIYGKLDYSYKSLIIFFEKKFKKMYAKGDDLDRCCLIYYRSNCADKYGIVLYEIVHCTISSPPWIRAGIYEVMDNDEDSIAYYKYEMQPLGDMVYNLGDGFTSRLEFEGALSNYYKNR